MVNIFNNMHTKIKMFCLTLNNSILVNDIWFTGICMSSCLWYNRLCWTFVLDCRHCWNVDSIVVSISEFHSQPKYRASLFLLTAQHVTSVYICSFWYCGCWKTNLLHQSKQSDSTYKFKLIKGNVNRRVLLFL